MRRIILAVFALGVLLGGNRTTFALDPSHDIRQYAHTAWTIRDGFAPGTAFAMAQTPDGYLWLGTEFGLYRSDGVRFVRWQPPEGQHLPENPYALLVTRDGTLWIGTFAGLASWNNGKLTQYPEVGARFITSLLEDREGTVWVGALGGPPGTPTGRLCAIHNGSTQCYGQDGALGSNVWSLSEDSSGALWAGAESGLWRWKPGPPKRYAVPEKRLADLTLSDDGRLIAGIMGGGLRQVVGDRLESYPIRSPMLSSATLPDRDIHTNKLLRDRDGGLWIGTNQRGLIHVHHGRTDVFTAESGLSGNIIAGIFEDREGNIWVSTAGGLDRFRELPVTTVTTKQGLSSDNVRSVLAATDGSVWIGTDDGLTRWQKGQSTVFHKADGLPDEMVQSMYQDDAGRIWVFTGHGLAWFNNGRFVSVDRVPSTEVYSITGDNAGNLWLSGDKGLSHLREGRLIENLPWTALGDREQAREIVFDQGRGGLWLGGLWGDGGVRYFKDGKVRFSYTDANGLTKGSVSGLRLDRDGAVWAATQPGGVSRIKDGRITTLTTRNGLPCDRIHWTTEGDDRSLWLYTACGLLRIPRNQVEAWMSDPARRVEPTLWDATDGASPLVASSSFRPIFAKAADGKLWFVTREDIEVVDPPHLALNKLPPPVHIEQIVADHKMYWQYLPGAAVSNLHLPALTRDLQIDYSALSLTAPEKLHFKYKLEGQDSDWREVVNDREVQYSNLSPGTYRFRVIACNNSGVWNEQGDTLEFSVAPAYFQTNWFRALCMVFFLTLVWAAYQWRLRQLHHGFEMTLEARVGERIRIARDLHDTLLQSFHAVLLRLQTVSQLLRERPAEAQDQLDSTIEEVAEAITEGRDAVQGLRESTIQKNDLALAICTLGEELATDSNGSRPAFGVAVEGAARNLHPIIRDEIYRIAAEALRNAFLHAQARKVEVEIHYDDEQFRLRVRDDGRGIDPAVLSRQASEGHFGLRGMRERATLIGGKLAVWSEVEAGTEVELRVPAKLAYTSDLRASWLSRVFAGKAKGDVGGSS